MPVSCLRCDDSGWVCENHPDQPFTGIRIIPHEAVPLCGSFEVRFPDGRPPRFFYWDDIAGRRLRPDLADSVTARREA
jgi:hypothetical protein